MKNRVFRRGDIYNINLGIRFGTSIQSGYRPCIVVSNRKNNEYASTLTIIPCTGKVKRVDLPTHVQINPDDVYGYLRKKTIALAEQITTIDKRYVGNKIGFIKEDSEVFTQIMEAVRVQIGATFKWTLSWKNAQNMLDKDWRNAYTIM